MLSFTPRSVTKILLAELPDRSRKVLIDRYGLSGSGDRRTLESIGEEYGITRERVRQIENHGIEAVRSSSAYSENKHAFENLDKLMRDLGGVLSEDWVLSEIPKNEQDRNHLVFLLTVGHAFTDSREDAHFRRRWHADETTKEKVERALVDLYEGLEADRLMSEEEFMELFGKMLKDAGVKNRQTEQLSRWLSLSKRVGRNPLGEWGRVESPHVRVKNTRDFAYLTLKRHGSPMHFSEVAKGITELFGKKAHPATTHNELIKDERFVLVGRGLYALKEWGYQPGVVRDVIRAILAREGELSRDEIIERVKRERYVKDATIIVNLQNNLFTRTADGRYTLAK